MVAMIFEFSIDPDAESDYRAEAALLRGRLTGAQGFEGVERFESVTAPGRFVALGYFTDEDAVTRWRTDPEHRRVQHLARGGLLTGYRLRMADVTRDYSGTDRAQAPA